VNATSRDHARTPMQWDDSEHAGFTDGDPWFALNENYPEVNAAAARADEDSVWHHYRRLVALRHDEEALVYGDYDLLLPDHEQVYAYTRTLDGTRVVVVLNWSAEPATFDADLSLPASDVVLSNYPDSPVEPVGATFRPYEAVVYRG
jgi:glycosidase